MNELVSVIVPVYNVEKYLEKCVHSIINQTYENTEIILIDDGSTDSSGKICDKFSELEKKIKVIHKDNGGVSSARNVGIENAKGEYISFVDSDDWIEPGMIEALYNIIISNDVQLAACNLYNEIENVDICNELKLMDTSIKILHEKDIYISSLNYTDVRGYLWNKLFSKKYITHKLDNSLMQCEDLLFVTQYMHNIQRIAYTQKKLYHYVRNTTERKYNYTNRNLTLMDAYEKIRVEYIENCPELVYIIERNLLKIYLNFRARYKIIGDNNNELYNKIKRGINKYFKVVICNSKISIIDKMNIILSFVLPKTMLQLKKKQLHKNQMKGKWQS